MEDFPDVCPYERWMEQLPESLHSVPLNFLAIPGSHDSFSYALNWKSKLAPDASPVYVGLTKVFGPIARCIISRWSKSQKLSFTKQLFAGIRYFDLRVAARIEVKERPFYLVHGMYALSLEEALAEFTDFLQTHPHEVILLDLNHFYAMEQADFQRLKTLLVNTFQSRLIPQSSADRAPSLSEVWALQQQVVVFFHSQFDLSQSFWDGSLCPSLWPNTTNPKKMLAYNEDRYRTARQTANSFLVCQGILTPEVQTIVFHPLRGLGYLSHKANPKFVPWTRKKQVGDRTGLNICIVDFVETNDYIGSLLALNVKRLSSRMSVARPLAPLLTE